MTKDSLLNNVVVPIAREGWPFIAIFSLVSLVLYVVYAPLGWVGLVLTLWCIYFFRNPDRVTPEREGLLISPADGIVQMIAEVAPPRELDMGTEPVVRVSVFMNVFDCHVNRIPCDGRVGRLVYVPGQFLNASFDKASEENERQMIRIDLETGAFVGAVQIAGLVARRIICYLEDDQTVLAGERFGLIRFGSRVDVYLPPNTVSQVIIGQKCISGETVIADLKSDEPARSGEVR
ncbi:MAG: phosphatidylserine decarboxylase [Rhodospirillaceae bacterium]|jgi:phosphatidylserine decarboxylase|nr:phosphatidylserine decarboxylase family protein [Rhodospirillaceae bacterium]MDC0998452.1 phosphatidylserine decarboxylase [Alphaproteobacteria bacterium]MBT4355960.1 phosphatidylserine decarboxylase [Rhodospirillaceae bacterium]MBT7731696.1 phosphatidylserine decarboxylase [Rhodospirillaceae bacterium]MDC1441424.1 phosphatidylserine decarboxylase [Rhodospirillaceae bacterium]|tara:strand:+ start:630 stop:1331 length:702 start_codon:yes stop_codon:yes gene_type:complete